MNWLNFLGKFFLAYVMQVVFLMLLRRELIFKELTSFSGSFSTGSLPFAGDEAKKRLGGDWSGSPRGFLWRRLRLRSAISLCRAYKRNSFPRINAIQAVFVRCRPLSVGPVVYVVFLIKRICELITGSMAMVSDWL